MSLSIAKIIKLLYATSVMFFAILFSSIVYIIFKGLDSLSSAIFLTFVYLFGTTLGSAGKIKEKQENTSKILLEWLIACTVGIILFIVFFLSS